MKWITRVSHVVLLRGIKIWASFVSSTSLTLSKEASIRSNSVHNTRKSAARHLQGKSIILVTFSTTKRNKENESDHRQDSFFPLAMPSYVNLNALKPAAKRFVREMTPPLPRNSVLLQPTPHQYFLSLPKGTIPPNVRIQNYLVGDKALWTGVTVEERYGGKKQKNDHKESRQGPGREGRKWGGLKWAVRER